MTSIFSRNVKAWAYDEELTARYLNERDRILKKQKIVGKNLEKELQNAESTYYRTLANIGEGRHETLSNTKALVIGSDYLAQLIAGGLAGLGIDRIMLVDDGRVESSRPEIFCGPSRTNRGRKKVQLIAEEISQINPNAEIRHEFGCVNWGRTYRFRPDVIIDATNDPISKQYAYSYCKGFSFDRPTFISASANSIGGTYEVSSGGSFSNHLGKLHYYNSPQQGAFTSGLIAGLALEEVRRSRFKYSEIDRVVNGNFHYVTEDRWITHYPSKRVLVVGGGALGNAVAITLALKGYGSIGIIDMDCIEDHNLTRQFLLRGRLGERKVDAIKERIRQINPRVEVNAIYGKVGSVGENDFEWLSQMKGSNDLDTLIASKFSLTSRQRAGGAILLDRESVRGYDLIFGCLDNKYARAWLNQAAIDGKILYVDGGTDGMGGQLAAYAPGHTKCIQCQLNLSKFPDQTSCAIDPSTVIPNLIIGNLMVDMAERTMMGHYDITGIQYQPFTQRKLFPFSRTGGNKHAC
ncbi:MAG: ThiF family adenylyltransferase [Nanoarchaeota archaeon]|nr:ThiF family adenylyltransferase [Nanoarchaeota archaeon]